MKQLYGLTETERVRLPCSPTARCSSTRSARRCPSVEIRIAEQRRGAVPQPGRVQGATTRIPRRPREAHDGRRLVPHRRRRLHRRATGTCKIIDRAKDVGRLTRRHAVRAQVPREQAEVLPVHQGGGGLRRTAATTSRAFVNIDLAAVGNWAERRNIAYPSYTDLAQKPEVYELIQAMRRAGQRATSPPTRAARARRSAAS